MFIEKEVLTKLDHPGIIKLYNFFQNADKIFFVVEFSNGGDFANFLKMNSKALLIFKERFPSRLSSFTLLRSFVS